MRIYTRCICFALYMIFTIIRATPPEGTRRHLTPKVILGMYTKTLLGYSYP